MHNTSSISNILVCAICLDTISPIEKRSELNCNHEFHQKCLQPWIDSGHDTCPLDRKKITSINGSVLHQTREVPVDNQVPLLENARAPHRQRLRIVNQVDLSSNSMGQEKSTYMIIFIYFSMIMNYANAQR